MCDKSPADIPLLAGAGEGEREEEKMTENATASEACGDLELN